MQTDLESFQSEVYYNTWEISREIHILIKGALNTLIKNAVEYFLKEGGISLHNTGYILLTDNIKITAKDGSPIKSFGIKNFLSKLKLVVLKLYLSNTLTTRDLLLLNRYNLIRDGKKLINEESKKECSEYFEREFDNIKESQKIVTGIKELPGSRFDNSINIPGENIKNILTLTDNITQSYQIPLKNHSIYRINSIELTEESIRYEVSGSTSLTGIYEDSNITDNTDLFSLLKAYSEMSNQIFASDIWFNISLDTISIAENAADVIINSRQTKSKK
jgi:hypothetical protein